MSIWNYSGICADIDSSIYAAQECIFCGTELKLQHLEDIEPWGVWKELSVERCPLCGWWKASLSHIERLSMGREHTTTKAAYGVLKNLDITDIKTPITEISDYLTLKYSEVTQVHPKKIEEVVGSVFRNLGYDSLVTNYSGDQGIDVVLHDAQSKLIGVQVKRYKNKIEAQDIRAFTGALLLGGYTKGIFVTTSGFRSGAISTAEQSAKKGVPIILMDPERFYDALKISQGNIIRESTWEMFSHQAFSWQLIEDFESFPEEKYYEWPQDEEEQKIKKPCHKNIGTCCGKKRRNRS